MTLLHQCKDRFIAANLSFTGKPMLENVVFMDSLEATYTDEDVPTLGNNSPSSSTSPFMGKDALECYQILEQLASQEGASINPEPFAMLDERSMQDETVLLCEAGEEGVRSVRAAFAVVESRLLRYFAADAGVDEDRETAAASGGVLQQ
jgi:hypothetical protein